MIGSSLGNLSHYFEIFPAIINKIFVTGSSFGPKLQAILQLAIATSSLGAGYGIMFSNCWNLHTLAKENHLIGSKLISTLNQHNVPVYCILAETLIGIIYILATMGNNIPLQQIGAFGCTLSYAFCVLALLANARKQTSKKELLLPIFGAFSCIILLAGCINGFLKNGSYSPLALFGFLIFGVVMFFVKKSQTRLKA